MIEDEPGMERGGEHSMTDTMKERASDMGGKVQEQAESQKDRAAGGLEKTASKMREQLGDKGGTTAQVSDKVAGQLERTAGYLREHETDEIWDDIEQYVKDHPMQAAIGAAVAGFVVARALR
jgi:ElaB/YqjD/DUF883 family membrane-anchored ribosome-binding protein